MCAHTFSKADRLKSQKQIEQLFAEGDSFTEFPFRVVWRLVDSREQPLEIAISVPKKKFPKAVTRNHMKRLLRESYRQRNEGLKKTLLAKGKKLQLMLIFLDTQLWGFADLDNKISVTLERLQKEL